MISGKTGILALSIAIGSAFAAPEFATHLFPHKDGEAGRNIGGNRNSALEVGRSWKKDITVGWITFQTGGTDLALASGSALTVFVDRVHNPGQLKVFALRTPVTGNELDVELEDLSFNSTAPIAVLNIARSDDEKVLRIDLGNLLSRGPFHGLVLSPSNGLRVNFGSKDSDVPPAIELRYALGAGGSGSGGQDAARYADTARMHADSARASAAKARMNASVAGLGKRTSIRRGSNASRSP